MGVGGGGGVEAAEGANSGGGNAAKGLTYERDHLVAFGEAVGIVAAVGGDVAVPGGVVEWGLVGLATLLGAEDLPEQSLLGVAKGQMVAFYRGGGTAVCLRAAAQPTVGAREGGVALDLVEHMGAGWGGGGGDDVRDVSVVVHRVPLFELCRGGAVVGAIAFVAQDGGGDGGGLNGGVPGGDGGVVAVGFGFDAVVDARVAEAVGLGDRLTKLSKAVEGRLEGGDVEAGTVLGGGEEGAIVDT